MESLANKRWLVRHTSLGAGPAQPGQPGHLSRMMNINDKKTEKKDKLDLGMKRKYIKKRDKDGKIIKKRRKLESERDSRPESPLETMMSGPVVSDLNIKAVRDGVERIRDKMVKKRKSSYDIDHIVIPMSMAATTRVEKIKYKEILVPSWREVNKDEKKSEEDAPEPVTEKKNEDVPDTVKDEPADATQADATTTTDDADEDFEDISDLAYKLRHVKAEEEERVRWATPLGRVHGGQRGHNQRGRARRLDSCRTEASSGANTPNPLSPEAIEDIVVSTRPSSPHDQPETPDTISSPPPVDLMTSPTTLMPTPLSSVPASVRGRRRTSSQTKSRDRNLSEASQHSQESSR